MVGTFIGDISGSKYEFNNTRSKNIVLMDSECKFTDDTVMSLAIAKAILECNGDYSNLSEKTTKCMREFGRKYRHRGYGGHFREWINDDTMGAYGSCGNGSAMRVCPVAYIAKNKEELKELSRKVTEVTHNHEDGIKGAECTAMCIFMALNGATKEEIKNEVISNYYPIDFTVNGLRETKDYFDKVCYQTVPQAVECFYESVNFEDAIKNAICISGDSDTLGAIVGAIAEAYYGVSEQLKQKALRFLPQELRNIYESFMKIANKKQPSNIVHLYQKQEVMHNSFDIWEDESFEDWFYRAICSLSQYELLSKLDFDDLLDADYCKKTFGVNQPILIDAQDLSEYISLKLKSERMGLLLKDDKDTTDISKVLYYKSKLLARRYLVAYICNVNYEEVYTKLATYINARLKMNIDNKFRN